LANELARAQRDMETLAALASKMADQAAQFKRSSDSKIAELQQSLQKERDRAEALASELATAGREVGSQRASKSGDETAQLKQAAANAIELRQSLQNERDRAQTLARDWAIARRDVETQKTLADKSGDETAQLKEAAESALGSLQKERDKAEALAGALAMARREVETKKGLASQLEDETTQLKQAAASSIELRQSLQNERDRAEALAGELAMAQRDVETLKALAVQSDDETAQLKQVAASAIELRQSLQNERDRAEALASELTVARRDVETQKALASGSADETAQFMQAGESVTAELRQSLQNERDRADALDRELAMARRHVETHVALAGMAEDEAAQVKRASESAAAELRQFLQKERDRVEALVNDLAMARREVETQAALASKSGKDAVENKRTAENATAELLQHRERAEALASELLMVRRDITRGFHTRARRATRC